MKDRGKQSDATQPTLPPEPDGRTLWRVPGWLRLMYLTGILCFFIGMPTTIFGSCEMARLGQLNRSGAWSVALWAGGVQAIVGGLMLLFANTIHKRWQKTGLLSPEWSGPDEETAKGGARYCFRIDRTSTTRTGEIWGDPGVVRWRYEKRASPPGPFLQNPFHKLEHVVKDLEGRDVVVIRRTSLIPSVFEIIDTGKCVGTIRLRSVLRNSYAIKLDGGTVWKFVMPLWTVRFGGYSNTGMHVWVLIGPSKMEWNVLMRTGTNDTRLLFALAFIHNEWWNYS
jgi:hypothetical protein